MTSNRRTVFLTDGGEVEKDYPGIVAAILTGARQFLTDDTADDAGRERWLQVARLCREVELQIQAVLGASSCGEGVGGTMIAVEGWDE